MNDSGLHKNLQEQIRMALSTIDYAKVMTERYKPYTAMHKQIVSDLSTTAYAKAMAERYKPYTAMHKQIVSALSTTAYAKAMTEIYKPYTAMYKQIMTALSTSAAAHHDFAKAMAERYKPHNVIQEHIRMALSTSAKTQHDYARIIAEASASVQQISIQLQDYTPYIQYLDNAIEIDGEILTHADIQKSITSDVILNPSKWHELPKQLKLLLLDFFKQALFTVIIAWIFFGEQPFNHLRHLQKNETREIKKQIIALPNVEYSPFVNQLCIDVYYSPKINNRSMVILPYGTDVRILDFKNKKRWLLIEWQDGDETKQGWVLGRYIFRPSKYRSYN